MRQHKEESYRNDIAYLIRLLESNKLSDVRTGRIVARFNALIEFHFNKKNEIATIKDDLLKLSADKDVISSYFQERV